MTTTSPGRDAARLHGRERGLLAVEDPRRAAVPAAVVAGQLDHAAVGRERAAQDHETAGRLERPIAGPDDLLARRLDGRGGLLADRAARHGGRVARAAAPRSSRRRASRRMPPAWCRSAATKRPPGLRSASSGHPVAHGVEVVDGQRHAGFAGDREQVQHRVGRAAAGDDAGDRVLDGLAREDRAGRDARVGAARRPAAPPRAPPRPWRRPSRGSRPRPSGRCRGTRTPWPSCSR